ncbi:hypothetical protein T439DRAFT_326278 [Meredithblackwellia eburnea MCA 4105]
MASQLEANPDHDHMQTSHNSNPNGGGTLPSVSRPVPDHIAKVPQQSIKFTFKAMGSPAPQPHPQLSQPAPNSPLPQNQPPASQLTATPATTSETPSHGHVQQNHNRVDAGEEEEFSGPVLHTHNSLMDELERWEDTGALAEANPRLPLKDSRQDYPATNTAQLPLDKGPRSPSTNTVPTVNHPSTAPLVAPSVSERSSSSDHPPSTQPIASTRRDQGVGPVAGSSYAPPLPFTNGLGELGGMGSSTVQGNEEHRSSAAVPREQANGAQAKESSFSAYPDTSSTTNFATAETSNSQSELPPLSNLLTGEMPIDLLVSQPNIFSDLALPPPGAEAGALPENLDATLAEIDRIMERLDQPSTSTLPPQAPPDESVAFPATTSAAQPDIPQESIGETLRTLDELLMGKKSELDTVSGAAGPITGMEAPGSSSSQPWEGGSSTAPAIDFEVADASNGEPTSTETLLSTSALSHPAADSVPDLSALPSAGDAPNGETFPELGSQRSSQGEEMGTEEGQDDGASEGDPPGWEGTLPPSDQNAKLDLTASEGVPMDFEVPPRTGIQEDGGTGYFPPLAAASSSTVTPVSAEINKTTSSGASSESGPTAVVPKPVFRKPLSTRVYLAPEPVPVFYPQAPPPSDLPKPKPSTLFSETLVYRASAFEPSFERTRVVDDDPDQPIEDYGCYETDEEYAISKAQILNKGKGKAISLEGYAGKPWSAYGFGPLPKKPVDPNAPKPVELPITAAGAPDKRKKEYRDMLKTMDSKSKSSPQPPKPQPKPHVPRYKIVSRFKMIVAPSFLADRESNQAKIDTSGPPPAGVLVLHPQFIDLLDLPTHYLDPNAPPTKPGPKPGAKAAAKAALAARTAAFEETNSAASGTPPLAAPPAPAPAPAPKQKAPPPPPTNSGGKKSGSHHKKQPVPLPPAGVAPSGTNTGESEPPSAAHTPVPGPSGGGGSGSSRTRKRPAAYSPPPKGSNSGGGGGSGGRNGGGASGGGEVYDQYGLLVDDDSGAAMDDWSLDSGDDEYRFGAGLTKKPPKKKARTSTTSTTGAPRGRPPNVSGGHNATSASGGSARKGAVARESSAEDGDGEGAVMSGVGTRRRKSPPKRSEEMEVDPAGEEGDEEVGARLGTPLAPGSGTLSTTGVVGGYGASGEGKRHGW